MRRKQEKALLEAIKNNIKSKSMKRGTNYFELYVWEDDNPEEFKIIKDWLEGKKERKK